MNNILILSYGMLLILYNPGVEQSDKCDAFKMKEILVHLLSRLQYLCITIPHKQSF